MWLYHGTYDMFYKQIKSSGRLKPGINTDTFTINLDNFINSVAGRNIRGNCIYLSCDKDSMYGFDEYFRISTSRLDTNRLFVADNRTLDAIICSFGKPESTIYAKKYIESYMGFIDYTKIRLKYNFRYRPEFLYFGDILV